MAATIKVIVAICGGRGVLPCVAVWACSTRSACTRSNAVNPSSRAQAATRGNDTATQAIRRPIAVAWNIIGHCHTNEVGYALVVAVGTLAAIVAGLTMSAPAEYDDTITIGIVGMAASPAIANIVTQCLAGAARRQRFCFAEGRWTISERRRSHGAKRVCARGSRSAARARASSYGGVTTSNGTTGSPSASGCRRASRTPGGTRAARAGRAASSA